MHLHTYTLTVNLHRSLGSLRSFSLHVHPRRCLLARRPPSFSLHATFNHLVISHFLFLNIIAHFYLNLNSSTIARWSIHPSLGGAFFSLLFTHLSYIYNTSQQNNVFIQSTCRSFVVWLIPLGRNRKKTIRYSSRKFEKIRWRKKWTKTRVYKLLFY